MLVPEVHASMLCSYSHYAKLVSWARFEMPSVKPRSLKLSDILAFVHFCQVRGNCSMIPAEVVANVFFMRYKAPKDDTLSSLCKLRGKGVIFMTQTYVGTTPGCSVKHFML